MSIWGILVAITIRVTLLLIIFSLLLCFPTTGAEDIHDPDSKEVLQGETPNDEERPTVFPDLSISSEDIFESDLFCSCPNEIVVSTKRSEINGEKIFGVSIIPPDLIKFILNTNRGDKKLV